MHVVVVGCGRVGSELARNLDQAGHSVAVIDKDRRAFQRYLPDDWGGKAVVGFGFDRDHLEQAGVRDAEALAAATGGDNSNILTARIARETYQIPSVVARIQDPRRAVIYERLGIPTVAQVQWTTDQVQRRLFPSESVVEWSDASGGISLLERMLPDGWAGQRLSRVGRGGAFRVAAVTRAGLAQMVGPNLVGQEGDVLHILVAREHVEDLDARLKAGAEADR
ncbi:MAG TPA: TrkA family potassium uptake protein [Acidimicrobiales bacterium]|nr:TrkA family potassium uptake protein [Acidimicrobiales bacterium]